MPKTSCRGNIVVAGIIHMAFVTAVPVYAMIYWKVFLPGIADRLPAAMPPFSPGSAPWLFVLISIVEVPCSVIVPMFMVRDSQQGAPLVRLIISDAFLESIGIYGLVGIYLGMPSTVSLILMAVSFALLLSNSFRLSRCV